MFFASGGQFGSVWILIEGFLLSICPCLSSRLGLPLHDCKINQCFLYRPCVNVSSDSPLLSAEHFWGGLCKYCMTGVKHQSFPPALRSPISTLIRGRLCSLPVNLFEIWNWVPFSGIKYIEKPKLISCLQHVTKSHVIFQVGQKINWISRSVRCAVVCQIRILQIHWAYLNDKSKGCLSTSTAGGIDAESDWH